MKYFDAHTHIQFVAYDADRPDAVTRARDAGVAMNTVGTQLDTSKSAITAAEQYDNVWATIGLHPVHTAKSYHDTKELGEGGAEFTSRGEVFDIEVYRPLAQHSRVIAIGECGLDYYRVDENTKEVQKKAFIEQIQLANEVNKPLMLHIRQGQSEANAYDDALELLKQYAKVRSDVHFFAGNWETASKFLDLGSTLSFTGVLTFTHDYDEVVKNTPLDRILSETDAPYITPVPYRGKRNEPLYVQEVVKRIAVIRGEEPDAVAAQLLSNAEQLFNISLSTV